MMDASSFETAIRRLDEATADVEQLARTYGVSATAMREATSWLRLHSLFLEAGVASARADAAAEVAQLVAELRELSVDPDKHDLEDIEGDAPVDAAAILETFSASTIPTNPALDRLSEVSLEPPAWIEQLWESMATVGAVDIFGFVVADLRPPDHAGRWLRLIEQPLNRSRQKMLCETALMALDQIQGPSIPGQPSEPFENYLRRFTRRLIGLDANAWPAVGQVLGEGRWRSKELPHAYVRSAASNIYGTDQRQGLKARSADVFAQLGSDAPRSLDLTLPGSEPTNDPFAALIPASGTLERYREVEIDIDLAGAVRRAGLGSDGLAFAQARLDGIARSEMADYLKWPPQKVAAVEKALQRVRLRLRSDLMS